MNYLSVDYAVLVALARTGTETAEHVLATMVGDLGWYVCAEGLSSSLAVLAKDGYVAVEPTGDRLRADTSVSLTDKGRDAVAVGGMAKLFAGAREKAMRKNERRFCALPRPAAEPLPLDRGTFADTPTDADSLFLRIDNAEDGFYAAVLTHAYEEDADRDGDADESAAVGGNTAILCDGDGVRRLMGDLLDVALGFTESRKGRKVLLSGVSKAYVLTFCDVADETGAPVMRLTAAPVLFNRQRFIGKRDSDLDYAQCGDNVLSVTFSDARELCAFIFCILVRRVDLFDAEPGENIHTLYEKLQ